MFDQANFLASQFPSHVTVNEKRAPTDESVRLLSEMQQAAENKVLKTTKLEANILNATVHSMKDTLNWHNQFRILLDLNGNRIQVDAYTDPEKSVEDQMRTLYDAIAHRIAAEIMPKVFKDSRQMFGIL